MSKELERALAALDALRIRFNAIAGLMDRTAAEREIEAILRPAPIYETVEEIVGWVNVYQEKGGNLMRGKTYDTEGECDKHRDPSTGYSFLVCQPIKVTVQREKKQPVERSAKVVLSKELWVIETTGDELPAESFKATLTWEE